MRFRARTVAAVLALVAGVDLTPSLPGNAFASRSGTDTVTVTTVSDIPCHPGMAQPISLRCAITFMNSANLADLKLIKFAIPTQVRGGITSPCPGGICTIAISGKLGQLPPITTNNLTIDGYSQSGAAPNSNPLHSAAGDNARITIRISGNPQYGLNGLQVQGASDIIKGLSITGFHYVYKAGLTGAAVLLLGPKAVGDKVIGNFLGLAPDSKTIAANAYGVVAEGQTLGGIHGDIIGTPAVADRNVISGNTYDGILLFEGTLQSVQGNYIGTDLSGALARPNGIGIALYGEGQESGTSHTGDTIGGAAAGAGNLISGNTHQGIFSPQLLGNLAAPNRYAVIGGNYIGTDASGVKAVPNGGDGIALAPAYKFAIGAAGSAPNLISGNGGNGVSSSGAASSNVIDGNTVGLGADGGQLPNGQSGIYLSNGAAGDTVTRNVVAYNKQFAVEVGATSGDQTHEVITGNSFFGNSSGGIDLRGQGSESCLFGPAENTPNDYTACPLIKSAVTDGVSGEACAGCTVEVYQAAGSADREGKQLIGTAKAPLCAVVCGGFTPWRLPASSDVTFTRGELVIALAIAPGGPGPAETSEFSRIAPVGEPLVVNTAADGAFPCTAGSYSLRCAIVAANKDGGGDAIRFHIPGAQCASGVCSLKPASPLPAVRAPSTSINAYTQPGAKPNTNPFTSGDNAVLAIHLLGKGGANAGDGLVLGGTWDDAEGLWVAQFAGHAGIRVTGKGAYSGMIMGNYAGADPVVGAPAQNGNGLAVDGGSTRALIGFRAVGDANVLSGNGKYGLEMEEGGGSIVYGNYIGTVAEGNHALGNGVSGIFLYGSSNNVIGAPGAGLGNLLSGNLSDGIDELAGNGNQISNNAIGTDALLRSAVPNGLAGVFLYAGQGNVVGGPSLAYGNTIGGNGTDGIDALAEPYISIANNSIGFPLSNANSGVFLGNTTTALSAELGRRHLQPDPRVRTLVAGYSQMLGTVAGNTIDDNGAAGIQLGQSADDNNLHIVISQNRMSRNGSTWNRQLPPGIDLTGSNPAECIYGASAGPNGGIACPRINSASGTGVSGTGCPGCTIEVFVSTNGPNDDGFGEGAVYLGSTTANADGFWTWSLGQGSPLLVGQYVTATQTSLATGSAFSNTSPFAQNYQVTNQS